MDFSSEPYSDELMMISFLGMGVKFEHANRDEGNYNLYISVPETSYKLDIYKKQMAGTNLAYRFKKTLEAMGVKDLIVRSKTRKGENWTEKDKEQAIKYYSKEFLKNIGLGGL